MTDISKTHVVVVGGGFGGVKVTLELAKHSDLFSITLISDRPDFRYYPTLYHTATGGKAAQSSIPLSDILEGKQVEVIQATVKSIDREQKTITLEDGSTVSYDQAVLAMGVITNYFGIPGMAEYSYGIKSIEDAKRFKNHLHQQLADDGKPDLNYLIVGGGPTGIELAGALPAYLKAAMAKHKVEGKNVNITLVEAAPSLVPRMPERMGKAIQRRLESMGVKVMLNSKVEGETADALTVNGEAMPSHTVVWTAGIANNPFFKDNNFPLNERGNKVVVDEHLQVDPSVYVIGDNAETEFGGLAQTALYDAVYTAEDIERTAKGQTRKPYVPKRPIYVIPVGEGWSAVLWGKTQLSGWVGSMLRSAADFRAFADYEPWWEAAGQWANEFGDEEECATCKE